MTTGTLPERLRAFPAFYSTDRGSHWYRSTESEPLCVEAARRLEALESALAALDKAKRTYDIVMFSGSPAEFTKAEDEWDAAWQAARRLVEGK